MALSSNGLGRDPLKVEIRVRFPLRLLLQLAAIFSLSGIKPLVFKKFHQNLQHSNYRGFATCAMGKKAATVYYFCVFVAYSSFFTSTAFTIPNFIVPFLIYGFFIIT